MLSWATDYGPSLDWALPIILRPRPPPRPLLDSIDSLPPPPSLSGRPMLHGICKLISAAGETTYAKRDAEIEHSIMNPPPASFPNSSGGAAANLNFDDGSRGRHNYALLVLVPQGRKADTRLCKQVSRLPSESDVEFILKRRAIGSKRLLRAREIRPSTYRSCSQAVTRAVIYRVWQQEEAVGSKCLCSPF